MLISTKMMSEPMPIAMMKLTKPPQNRNRLAAR
jgi:hypothetical protein